MADKMKLWTTVSIFLAVILFGVLMALSLWGVVLTDSFVHSMASAPIILLIYMGLVVTEMQQEGRFKRPQALLNDTFAAFEVATVLFGLVGLAVLAVPPTDASYSVIAAAFVGLVYIFIVLVLLVEKTRR